MRLLVCLFLVLISAIIGCSLVSSQSVPTPYWRPHLHFSPTINWTNDPNGLIWDPLHKLWHLFLQYNPNGNEWGKAMQIERSDMSWGHAISNDLISWEELPVAILFDKDVAIFSGSAVWDANNTSLLCNETLPDSPCIVCVWAGNSATKQDVNIAYSTDPNFEVYKKYEGNPVIDINSSNFRDPAAFWYETGDSGYWVVVVAHSDVGKVQIYSSPNLTNWTYMSSFGPADKPGGWECPDMFPLILKGTNKRMWVLTVSVEGSTGDYWVGDFNGTHFTVDSTVTALSFEAGIDFYAAITYNNVPDNRRILIGWMNNWGYASAVPTYPWRGSFTIPREITLHNDSDITTGKYYLALHQEPVKELLSYTQHFYTLDESVVVTSSQNQSSQNILSSLLNFNGSSVCDIDVTFLLLRGNSEFGFYLRTNDSLSEYTSVSISSNSTGAILSFDRRLSGVVNFNQAFPTIATHIVPFPISSSSAHTIQLRILLDSSSVEIFLQNGRLAASYQIFPTVNSTSPTTWTENDDIKFFVSTGEIVVESLTVNDYKGSNKYNLKYNSRVE